MAVRDRLASRIVHSGLVCLSSIRQDHVGSIVKLVADFAEQYGDEDVSGQVFWL